MNKKNMSKALEAKMNDWLKHIEDDEIVKIIKKNAIITGGALVSLLTGEEPNDYDVYFKTKEACYAVTEYYARKWNTMYPIKPHVEVRIGKKDADGNITNKDRITCFIKSVGIAAEDNESGIDDISEPAYDGEPDVIEDKEVEKPRYRPRYFSTNAISLSDKIQIVIRFHGPVEEIHKNYDYAHCMCSYDYKKNEVNLPEKALECIINKELYYMGSRYPLCSIIRSRKFITRGWHINAGQYLKMCLQLNELNLHDFETFKDQLAGVDSTYFASAIEGIEKRMQEDKDFTVDNNYLFETINRIFRRKKNEI